MRRVLAFMHNANQKQTELAKRVCKILGEIEVEIYNIPQHRVEDHIKNNSIVLAFGIFASTAAEQYITEKQLTNVRLLKLPHLKYLKSKTENIDYRASTFKKLQELKSTLEQDTFMPMPEEIVIKEEDLPALSARQIVLLEKMTEERNQETCLQTSKDGKLIEISCYPREGSKADIQITFQELYTIRAAMDILKVSEVTLVRNKKDINQYSTDNN